MQNLQEATEHICSLKGTVLAQHALLTALIRTVHADRLPILLREYQKDAEVAATVLLHGQVSEHTRDAFELETQTSLATIRTKMRDMNIREG